METVITKDGFEELMDNQNMVVTTLHIPDENISVWKSSRNFEHMNSQLKDVNGVFLVCTRAKEHKISFYHFFTENLTMAYRINYMLGEMMEHNNQVDLINCLAGAVSTGAKQDMYLSEINPNCKLVGK